jgi:hypothetical protein
MVVVLRSGRRLAPALVTDDPLSILDALAARGVPAGDARRHPWVVWAAARRLSARRWWDHPLVKFAGFAALPAAILFRAHQYIAYGGFWGEWLLLGPAAWLGTLAAYWATTALYALLFAGLLRGAGEIVAIGAAAAAPSHAARVRQLVETACRTGYFGGIPLLLLLRFLP